MNDDNLKGHEFTSNQSREKAATNGRKGGVASGVSRRKHKAIRELLLSELRKVGPNGLTKEEYLVAKALENHAKGKLTFKDLQDLQQLLGEAVEKHEMNVQGRVEYVPEGVDELIKKHCK